MSGNSGLVVSPELADSLWLKQLQSGGSVTFLVASNSMLPTLSRGDRITVKRIPPADRPKLGDIILFFIGSHWVVHRIVGRGKKDGEIFYRQKGDAEFRASVTPASEVAGRVFMIDHGDDRVVLDATYQKTVSRTIGYSYFLLDLLLRTGAGIFRHDLRQGENIPTWHIRVTAGIKKIQDILARAAVVTRRFSHHFKTSKR